MKTRAFLQLANGIAKGMVVLRAGGNPKGGQKREAGRTKARRRGNAGERPGAVERGAQLQEVDHGERGHGVEEGGSRPGDRDISGQKNPGHIVREI